ncbi:hypothetical protein A2625_04475 [candidate division WOR-1 bacterium RIFCSPHIGHO2_01_FULL_53_15]|uniref:EF-hand domain-containing protein n=1 Tax=candidate division WOR-1 bacterium RIFCSPHIGHO2_01_FULL_53_15 TaxID=1802564 RepID=A0A1F4PZ42_UNCSA|nr:MAG: hypothetical protein A2625_04475 [candidate division WOR-1 bacterium RIFCSPHIGHO2_01_FULL_53_15]
MDVNAVKAVKQRAGYEKRILDNIEMVDGRRSGGISRAEFNQADTDGNGAIAGAKCQSALFNPNSRPVECGAEKSASPELHPAEVTKPTK